MIEYSDGGGPRQNSKFLAWVPGYVNLESLPVEVEDRWLAFVEGGSQVGVATGTVIFDRFFGKPGILLNRHNGFAYFRLEPGRLRPFGKVSLASQLLVERMFPRIAPIRFDGKLHCHGEVTL